MVKIRKYSLSELAEKLTVLSEMECCLAYGGFDCYFDCLAHASKQMSCGYSYSDYTTAYVQQYGMASYVNGVTPAQAVAFTQSSFTYASPITTSNVHLALGTNNQVMIIVPTTVNGELHAVMATNVRTNSRGETYVDYYDPSKNLYGSTSLSNITHAIGFSGCTEPGSNSVPNY